MLAVSHGDPPRSSSEQSRCPPPERGVGDAEGERGTESSNPVAPRQQIEPLDGEAAVEDFLDCSSDQNCKHPIPSRKQCEPRRSTFKAAVSEAFQHPEERGGINEDKEGREQQTPDKGRQLGGRIPIDASG